MEWDETSAISLPNIDNMQTIDINFQDRHGWNYLLVSITPGSPFTDIV